MGLVMMGDHLPEIVELLRDLIQIDSTNPPGNEDGIAGYIAEFLKDAGIKPYLIRLEEGRSSVAGMIPGRERGKIALCGHIDTVGVNEERWSYPPFEGIIENGRVYGRGASDMKGGIALILHLAKVIKHMDKPPRKTLLLALTADEEKDYRGAESLVERGFFDDAEFLIVTEPTDGRAFIGEKGELWMRAIFLGKAAHGSVPETGLNAILPAAGFCTRISDAAQGFEEVEGLGKTTLNIGRFAGGWQVNIVPDKAEVELDFRVISEEAKELAVHLVDALGKEEAKKAGAEFEHEILSYHPPILTDRDDRYVKEFLRIVSEMEQRELKGEVGPYCTDAATIVPKVRVPFILYGPGTIALAHQPDEYIEISSLGRSFTVLIAFLREALSLG